MTDKLQDARQRGRDDRSGDNPEPKCPYTPGSDQYREYAEGFMEQPVDVKRFG